MIAAAYHAHSAEADRLQPDRRRETRVANRFDLTQTSLVTTKAKDERKRKWDAKDETGVRYESGPKTVEYYRDVKPIFELELRRRAHSGKSDKPAGNLRPRRRHNGERRRTPGAAGLRHLGARHLCTPRGRQRRQVGYKPLHQHKWSHLPNLASRYVCMMQRAAAYSSGEPMANGSTAGRTTICHTKRSPATRIRFITRERRFRTRRRIANCAHIGYTGSVMPPPDAVKNGKVAPLGDEDKLTLVRWVDLGCPIDLQYDPKSHQRRMTAGRSTSAETTLALTLPKAGENATFDRILVGMHDTGTGIDAASFLVIADFAIDGFEAGENLAKGFKSLSPGVEAETTKPVTTLAKGTLTVSVRTQARQHHAN